MNYASVVARLFGRVPTNLSIVSLVESGSPEAVAVDAARMSLAEFGDAPRVVGRVGDRFVAVGQTHAVLQGGSDAQVARLSEEDQQAEPEPLIRDLTPVETKNARAHVRAGRKLYRFGKFKPGMSVTWRGDRWVVMDARARGGTKFTLMLVTPTYDKLADEVPPAEIGESETVDEVRGLPTGTRVSVTLSQKNKTTANGTVVGEQGVVVPGVGRQMFYQVKFDKAVPGLSNPDIVNPDTVRPLKEGVDEARRQFTLASISVGGVKWELTQSGNQFSVWVDGEEWDYEEGELFGSKPGEKTPSVPAQVAKKFDAVIADAQAEARYVRDSVDEALQHGDLKARMDKLDAKFEELLAKRKAAAGQDGDGKWRTTQSGHKIYIDGSGKVTKGNPHVLKAADGKSESIDEARSAPHWRALVDELLELAGEIDAETEVSLEVWRGNWSLQIGPGKPQAGRKSAWAEGTIDPGMTPEDAKELAVDMLDQIKGMRQHDESVDERTTGANLAGWRLASSSTGVTVKSPEGQVFYVVLDDDELKATNASGDEISVSKLPGYAIRAIEKMLGAPAESIDESMPKMAKGQVWALSYTGDLEDPDAWLFVTGLQKNGAPAGVKYDVRTKRATFSSFNGFNGKFTRQDRDAFDDMTADLDAQAVQKVSGTLAQHGFSLSNHFESIDEAAYGAGVEVTVAAVRGSRETMWLVRKDGTLLGYVTKFKDTRTSTNPWKAFRYKSPTKDEFPADPDADFLGTTYRGKLKGAVAAVVSGQKLVQDTPESVDEAKAVPAIDSPTYRDVAKLPKYNVKVSPLSAHGSDGGKLLVRRLPDWTKADHLAAAAEHEKLAAQMDKQWGVEANAAAQAAWGRDYKASDYRISGIASDEFDSKHKDELRRLAHTATAHKEAAHAHKMAARMRSLPKESVDEATYYLIQRGTDGKFLNGTDFEDEDPGFGFRDMATAQKAAQAEVIRGRLRKGQFRIVRRDDDDPVDEAAPSAPLFTFKDSHDFIEALRAAIKAPFVEVSRGPLWSATSNPSVHVTISVDPKESWANGIMHNSRYGLFSVSPDGAVEKFSGGYKAAKFRKTRAKSAQDVAAKLNAWVKASGTSESADVVQVDSFKDFQHDHTPVDPGSLQARASVGEFGQVDEGYQHVHFEGSKSARAKIVMAGGKTKSVQGRTFDDVLLVHPTGNYQWGVTHIPTGLGLVPPPGFADDREAVKFAKAASALGGWDFTDPSAVPPALSSKMGSLISAFRPHIRKTGGNAYESELAGQPLLFEAESVDEMAKLSAGGRAELMRASKETTSPDDESVDWRRVTRAWMDDGKVLEKLDVNFKATGDAAYQKARKHSYGWKVTGKIKAELLADPTKLSAALASTRTKLEAAGWSIESFHPPQ